MSKASKAASSAVRAVELRIVESIHNWNEMPTLLQYLNSSNCNEIFFALNAVTRVFGHMMESTMQQATSNGSNTNTNAKSMLAARDAVLAQCAAHRRHLLQMMAFSELSRDKKQSSKSLFGNADESQRRGLRIAALQNYMELLQVECANKSASAPDSSRARHLFDAVQLRDLLLVLCDVPASARRSERIKLSLNDMALGSGLNYDPENDADSDVDEPAAMAQLDSAERADAELLALIDEFAANYGSEYDDVRFYSMRLLANLCESVRRATTVGKCTLAESARFSRLSHALLTGIASVAPDDDESLHFFVPILPGKSTKRANGDASDESNSQEGVNDALHDDDVDDATFIRKLMYDSDSEGRDDAADVDTAQTGAKSTRKRKNQSTDSQDGVLRVESRREHRKEFGNCWLAFLRLPLPLRVFKLSLSRLADRVLPHMEQPLLLCDLLSNAFSRGGVIALLALSGLFELIVKHNLDYPMFFEQLYSLLEPSIFLVKYRARFFELMSMFLGSPMLPAATAAAFVRRALRLAATGPVYAGLLVVPFAINVIRRHPSCVPMIHREELIKGMPTRQAAANSTSLFAAASTKLSAVTTLERKSATVEEGVAKWVDPFNPEEALPDLSRAIDSSMFEIEALRRSFYPTTADIVEVFEQPIGIAEHLLGNVLTTDYNELMNSELVRHVRKSARTAATSDLGVFTDNDKLFAGANKSDEEWIRRLTGDDGEDEDDDEDDDDGDESDGAEPALVTPQAIRQVVENPDDEDYE